MTTPPAAKIVRTTEWGEGIDGMSRVLVLEVCPHCKIKESHAFEFEGKQPKCWNCLREITPERPERQRSSRRTYNCYDVRLARLEFAQRADAAEVKARKLMESLKPTEAEAEYMIDILSKACRTSTEKAIKKSADLTGALNLLLESEPFNMQLMLAEVARARG